jgi:NAD(P)-dependent dehydrogenase (short-subunit alcohol dehydrogenase family)
VAAFLATDPPPVTDFAPIGSGPHTAKIPVAPVRVPPPTDDLPPAPTTSRVPISRPDPVTPPLSESVAPATEPMSRLKPVDDLAVLLDPPPVRLPVDLPAAPTISAAYPETNRQPVAMIHTDRIDRSILQAVDLDLTATRHKLPLPATGEVWVVGPDEPFTRGLIGHLTAARLSPTLLPWADPDAVKPGGFPVGLVLVAPARQPAGPAVSKIGFRWLQYAGGKLRQAVRPGSAALFATVARLDGAFGLADLDPATDPAGGGLAGLVKTAKQEWPEVSGKAIDVAAKFVAADPDGAAAAVADELRLAGPLEVGVSQTHRCGLETARTARRQTATGPALTRSDVVLVTGGGRGVTAEVAVALAQVYQPTLVLTGRTPAPTGPEPDWSAGLSDEASLKKAIAAQLGDGATPKAVGDFYHRLMAQREVARTLRRIEQAGAVGVYAAVNAANARQVADLVQKVTVKHGPVTAVVHGAGVLADKRIEDLTAEQFDAVYSTKVDGLRTVLDLLAHQELKAVMLFSSTTARYGRAGQVAYACANEVLNKMAQVEARRRPACRVVAVNWGPWDGGMVTPALRRVFESEGHGLIPLTEGGLFAVQELTAAGKAVEVIALGKPAKSGRSGVDAPVAAPTPVPTPSAVPPKPAPVELRPAFERTLAVDTHPVLRSHVLDGRAVLPMALHLELLAHAALHAHPGLVFHGLNDLRIIHGVMVEDGGATPLTVVAGKATKDGAGFLVRVELRGKRRDGRDTIHTQAEVVLAASLPKPPTADPAPVVQPYPHPVDEVYKYFLFHGPDLQGIERVDGLSETAFVGTAYPAPPPAEWFSQPLRSGWLADPLVLDASFQMMILWSYAQHGAGSLPCFAGRFRQYRRAFPAGPVKVVIRVTKDNGQFARADIDYLDADGVVVAQVQDYECVIDRQLDAAFRKNQLAPKAKV